MVLRTPTGAEDREAARRFRQHDAVKLWHASTERAKKLARALEAAGARAEGKAQTMAGADASGSFAQQAQERLGLQRARRASHRRAIIELKAMKRRAEAEALRQRKRFAREHEERRAEISRAQRRERRLEEGGTAEADPEDLFVDAVEEHRVRAQRHQRRWERGARQAGAASATVGARSSDAAEAVASSPGELRALRKWGPLRASGSGPNVRSGGRRTTAGSC